MKTPLALFSVPSLVACCAFPSACTHDVAAFTGDGSAGGGPAGQGGGGNATGSVLPDASAGGSLLPTDASVGNVSPDGGAANTSQLTVTIRDFRFWNASDPTSNPDFQNAVQPDHTMPPAGPAVVGTIVSESLGSDRKPVYKNVGGMTRTTHGKAFFDQWYNDVAGTNFRVEVPLTLSAGAQGTYGYDSTMSGVPLSPGDPRRMWFPIDDGTPYATPFGNQGQRHNYSFTTELHTVFVYRGGETFSFSGDDDVFVFIDGRLVLDLGGVHVIEQATVRLDDLGLVKGSQYPLDLFNAERHTLESNLSFTTTLELRPPPK